jgi:hypothetical protein
VSPRDKHVSSKDIGGMTKHLKHIGFFPDQFQFLSSGEFLFHGYEIQDAGTMEEETVPVPPYRPCAEQ